MPRFTNRQTGHVVETSNPTERVQLLASGYAESKARTAAGKAADTKAEADKTSK